MLNSKSSSRILLASRLTWICFSVWASFRRRSKTVFLGKHPFVDKNFSTNSNKKKTLVSREGPSWGESCDYFPLRRRQEPTSKLNTLHWKVCSKAWNSFSLWGENGESHSNFPPFSRPSGNNPVHSSRLAMCERAELAISPPEKSDQRRSRQSSDSTSFPFPTLSELVKRRKFISAWVFFPGFFFSHPGELSFLNPHAYACEMDVIRSKSYDILTRKKQLKITVAGRNFTLNRSPPTRCGSPNGYEPSMPLFSLANQKVLVDVWFIDSDLSMAAAAHSLNGRFNSIGWQERDSTWASIN